jgi:hypothetical protein
MSSADRDHKTLFLRNYELYERAKRRGEPFSDFAVIALAQIHNMSGVSAAKDRDTNVQVMHDLLGPLHTEAEIREKYDQIVRRAARRCCVDLGGRTSVGASSSRLRPSGRCKLLLSLPIH